MINWVKDTWEEVKFTLDALELDYEIDFEGNLLVCFSDFNIVDERSKEVVDHVDKIWLKFAFAMNGRSYDLQFYRVDVYSTKPRYTHPHVSEGGNHCTGDYIRAVSLCRDLLYYKSYVTHYNKGDQYTNLPEQSVKIDKEELNKRLIPTFYMDISKGYPCVSNVEFEGGLEEFITTKELPYPKIFHWKSQVYKQYSKGFKVEHIDLKKYFDYAKFYQRYSDSTCTVSNADTV